MEEKETLGRGLREMMMLQPPRPPLLMRLLALLLCVLLVANPPVASARRSKKQPAAKKAPAAPAGGGGPPPGLTPQVMAQLRPVMEAAEGFAATGQKQRAIEQYLAALRLFPDFDMAHYNLGVTFEETGQFEESSMHYRHTLRLLPHGDPRRADVLSRLGQLSARLGELLTGPQHADQRLVALQEAETMLSEASELQPRNAQLRFSLGKVCGELGKGKQSIKHLTAALKSAPDHPPMQLQLGLALHRHGGAKRAEDAKRYLDAALTAEHADYHAQVGLQLREDMPERARAHFERALELDPKHSQATSTYYRLGAMLHLLGETEEEEALYERAVEAGVWKDAKQRPGYFAPGAQAQAAWPEADQWPELAAAISLLEAKHPTIKAELLQAMKGESGGGGGGGGGSAGEGEGEGLPPLLADEDTLGRLRTGAAAPHVRLPYCLLCACAYRGRIWSVPPLTILSCACLLHVTLPPPPPPPLLHVHVGIDNENLTDSGLWRQRIYMRNGLPLFEAGETGAEGASISFFLASDFHWRTQTALWHGRFSVRFPCGVPRDGQHSGRAPSRFAIIPPAYNRA